MARYARLEVAGIVLLGGLAVVLLAMYAHWAVALLPTALMAFLLWFYRDPPRRIPAGAELLLAPADGRVVEIATAEPAPDGGRVLRILIFLNVFNVHVNRSPCAGRVTAVAYRPGRFLNALKAESTAVNEANTLTLDPAEPLPGPIRVRQIAGVLARRIVCAAQPGDALAAGERYGMIKLGSRTELVAPADPRWELCVKVGDRVRGGSTILAKLRSAPAPQAAAG